MIEIAGLENLPDEVPLGAEGIVNALRSALPGAVEITLVEEDGRFSKVLCLFGSAAAAWRAASRLGMARTVGFREASVRVPLRVSLRLDGTGEVVPFPATINALLPKRTSPSTNLATRSEKGVPAQDEQHPKAAEGRGRVCQAVPPEKNERENQSSDRR